MLSDRKATILRTIVRDYVAHAQPVGSEHLARTYELGVSSATIRNEMADLEEMGFITHPHTSAGRVPADKGYRYYVESLMVEAELSTEERFTIGHQFHQVERDFEEWSRLAAAVLSQSVHNAAVVTFPQAPETRPKHVSLVWLQEFLALLVVVFQTAQLRRQILVFEEPVTQEKLDGIAQRLNASLGGRTPNALGEPDPVLEGDPVAQAVQDATARLVQQADEQRYQDLYLDGLRHVFRQPEFANSAKMQQVLEVMEERRLLGEILPRLVGADGVQVIIGQENREDAMRECSVVLTHYRGAAGDGLLGVIGPTRMDYERTVPMVRFMGSLMSDLLQEIEPQS